MYQRVADELPHGFERVLPAIRNWPSAPATTVRSNTLAAQSIAASSSRGMGPDSVTASLARTAPWARSCAERFTTYRGMYCCGSSPSVSSPAKVATPSAVSTPPCTSIA